MCDRSDGLVGVITSSTTIFHEQHLFHFIPDEPVCIVLLRIVVFFFNVAHLHSKSGLFNLSVFVTMAYRSSVNSMRCLLSLCLLVNCVSYFILDFFFPLGVYTWIGEPEVFELKLCYRHKFSWDL